MFIDEHVGTQLERRPKGRRRGFPGVASGVAFGVIGVLFGSSAASAAGLDTYPDDPAEAEASIAELTLDGADLIGLAHSNTGSLSNAGTERKPLAGSIAGTEVVDFGAGFTIPLDQFIDFGQAGALFSESTSADSRNGEAISGIAGADGGLTLDTAQGDFGSASIDLLSLFEASGVDGATDLAVDRADFAFGLGGAWVEAIEGEFQDPDGIGGLGQYRAADAKLVIHSPAVEQAADGLSMAAGQMEQAILDAVNPVLGLGELIPGATIDTTLTSDLQQDVLDAVLLAPITTDDGLFSIDIGAGTITFDVGRFGGNDDGVRDPSLPTGINNQNPNTELIDSDTYPFIASSIHDLIEKVIDVGVNAAISSLESVNINVAIESLGTTAGWDMTLAGAVTNDFCTPDGLPGIPLCATINTFLATVPGVMEPVLAGFTDPESPLYLYNVFTAIKTDLITVPIRAAVDPFLELAAQVAFSVQLNHQETQTCVAADGTETLSALEVSALSFGVAGGLGRFDIGNAGVRIAACDLAAPAVSATSPAPAGGESALTSSGWAPEADVSVQLTGPDGEAVGDPVVVTTDAAGGFPDGTSIAIPADAAPGDYTVVASGPDGVESTAELTVYAPTLAVQSPVAPDDCTAVTSSGWLPEAPLSLQLTDAEGAPVGAAVEVTTDETGGVPEGTCVPIPADLPEGDYTVVATDGNGAELTAEVTVQIGAITPTMALTSPVPAGGETAVTSAGWAPGATVSLQLTDEAGDPVGEPLEVTADVDGALPDGTVLSIPLTTAPGDGFTVLATDGNGVSVTAPLTVSAAELTPTLEATSPVPAGGDVEVQSDGWVPGGEVSLQLVDGDSAPIGDPVVVTATDAGALPADTAVPVPADTPAGDYTISASDDFGNEAAAGVSVYAPVLDASSPVVAGDASAVTSSGWLPDSQLTLRLTDAGGDPVGDAVQVVADASGSVPTATAVPVPEDAVAGGYAVTAVDDNGATVSDEIEVLAADDVPVATVSSPVAAGGEAAVVSTGWSPGAEVTIQLVDGSGDPVGDPIVVVADDEGALPEGTVVPVPADAAAGEYEIRLSDGADHAASAALSVYAPTLEADAEVQAGEELPVASGGWVPGTEVTIGLIDGTGEAVAEPVVVVADGSGDLPDGTALAVPEDVAPGDYVLVASDENGAEVTADVAVTAAGPGAACTDDAAIAVAPATAAPGETVTVTGTGFPAGSTVDIQLYDADGAAMLGSARAVTVGDTCGFTVGITIPADVDPGSYDFVATGEDDESVSVALTVTGGSGAAGGPAATGGLATTGGEFGTYLPLSLALLALGALAVAIRRRGGVLRDRL